jgi:hypothetical protein
MTVKAGLVTLRETLAFQGFHVLSTTSLGEDSGEEVSTFGKGAHEIPRS